MICHLCTAVPPKSPAEPREAIEGSNLCLTCFRTLDLILRDIERLFHHVSDAQFLSEQRDRDAERWVGSKAPTDSQVLSILDRRTVALSPGDPISVERVLRCWSYAIQDSYGPGNRYSNTLPHPRNGDRSVSDEIQFHRHMLAWISQTDTVVRYARHMAAIRHQLLRLVPRY